MKIRDYSFYKKNMLNRYLLSKELSSYREAVKQDKAKKLNDFIIPVFSATLTISSSYYLKASNILNNFFWQELAIAFVFIAVYVLSVYIVRFYHYISNYIMVHGIIFDDKDERDISDILEYFNIDIINQVLLAYNLVKDSEESGIEINLKNHFVFESLFYLKRSLDKMNEEVFKPSDISVIFGENENSIEIYRVKLAFDMLKETYWDIYNSSIEKSLEFEKDMKITTSLFNRLVQRLREFVEISQIDS
jgi:hypothetical protein